MEQNKFLKLILGFIAVMIIVFIGGYFYLQLSHRSSSGFVTQQSLPLPTTSPSPEVMGAAFPFPQTYSQPVNEAPPKNNVSTLGWETYHDDKGGNFDIKYPQDWNFWGDLRNGGEPIGNFAVLKFISDGKTDPTQGDIHFSQGTSIHCNTGNNARIDGYPATRCIYQKTGYTGPSGGPNPYIAEYEIIKDNKVYTFTSTSYVDPINHKPFSVFDAAVASVHFD